VTQSPDLDKNDTAGRSAVQDNTRSEPNAADLSRAAAAAEATAPVESTLSSYFNTWVQRVRGGDIGSLPAIGGLIVLVILFGALQSSFRTLGSLANITNQASYTIILAMGLVFVLLLGEIDLGAGTSAGFCAAIMARITIGYTNNWFIAIAAALVAGIILGIATGWLVAKLRIPSFVVTLALFLAYQGLTLLVVNNFAGQHGNLTINNNFIANLNGGQMAPWLGWVMAIVVVVGYALVKLSDSIRRRRAGLIAEPMTLVAIKIGAMTVFFVVLVLFFNTNRALNTGGVVIRGVRQKEQVLEGVPWVVPVIIFFAVVWTLVLSRTRYGRHVYAVGGNAEAARRAGIAVDRIRISVFAINSFMAAIAGVLLASYTDGFDASIGGRNTLLLAVGAAVIGGTSLFGGKGRPLDAVIGGLVLAVITYGMSNLVKGVNGSAVQLIITGAVLVLAAAVDALARRRAGSRGL
jgi:D-xylose transport system permease protein